MANNMRRLTCLICSLVFCSVVSGQNIKGHYVVKNQEDGAIYHTMPEALFENSESGSLIFDLTYKQHSGVVTLNFSFEMSQPMSIDSVRFVSSVARFGGEVRKMYVEPNKKQWKHRYSLSAPLKPFYLFFDESALPEVLLYSGGKPIVFKAKKSAWKSYAPIGYKIFDMIRFNEQN